MRELCESEGSRLIARLSSDRITEALPPSLIFAMPRLEIPGAVLANHLTDCPTTTDINLGQCLASTVAAFV